MKTLKGYFSAFVKHPPEDIKNPPPPFLMQWVYKFTLCDIIHSWACASEDTAIPVVPKDRRTLRETYVHLTPLSHVWHFSNITVMTEPLWGFGAARSNMENIYQSNSTEVTGRTNTWIMFPIVVCGIAIVTQFKAIALCYNWIRLLWIHWVYCGCDTLDLFILLFCFLKGDCSLFVQKHTQTVLLSSHLCELLMSSHTPQMKCLRYRKSQHDKLKGTNR